MTENEKQQFQEMQEDLKHIYEQTESHTKKLDQILKAISGDPLSGNIGFTARLQILEKDVSDLREERIKNSVYIKIITWLSVVIGTGVIGFILSLVLKK